MLPKTYFRVWLEGVKHSENLRGVSTYEPLSSTGSRRFNKKLQYNLY